VAAVGRRFPAIQSRPGERSLWAVSSIGQRNTYLDRRMWSDDDEARISQDEGFGG